MPLSELYRMARGSLDQSSQQKPTSSSFDLSHLPDNDEFVELIWENGQIMMQGQSSRPKRITNPNNPQTQIPKFRDRDLNNANNPKTGRYGLMGSILDDFNATVPSSEIDEEMAPWLNYNDSLSDFLPELSSVTINDLPLDKKNTFSSSFNGGNQPLAPSTAHASSSGFSNACSGIINFSHFSRPVSIARADIENKGKFVASINASGSDILPNLLPKIGNTQNNENNGSVLREDNVRKDVPHHQGDSTAASKGMRENEKVVEPIVASSSVCSGNNPEQNSDDQNPNLKRKSRETDDSEGRSEDLEEESVGIRKAAPARGGTGTKRSRAAEVHNLSERRRRDRINEKMRALQELIPNCNKVDKASMLDEAIEYLKTLQLQVQIMSMGAGMYMPHLMLPAQHLPTHMAHFPPMMGMGFGMGMMDMNGGARFHGPRAMPFSGPSNFQMMAGTNLFGPSVLSGPMSHQPGGPGFPVSAPCHPSVSVSAGFTNPCSNDISSVKEVNDALPS